MPKSKRAKVVHLTKTQKKGKELTIRLFSNIQQCIPQYPYIYVFGVDNMRNTYLKDIRSEMSDSRLFFGKTKVMSRALSSTTADTPPSTSRLSPHLSGACGLLFSPRPPTEVLDYFSTFTPLDFARAGITASRPFSLPAGTVYSRGGELPPEDDVPVQQSLEPSLRNLGLPTRMEKGRVVLDEAFEICKEGEVLGSRQTSLLKAFGVAMAEFRVMVRAYWAKELEKVTVVEEVKEGGMDVDVDVGKGFDGVEDD
ncbi:MAG: hypothetical protein LQ351_003244 [Letrouitia transgressa]|nr:MAG: hypothetical protein LQ351_003244 [Letrouitia transgressa]